MCNPLGKLGLADHLLDLDRDLLQTLLRILQLLSHHVDVDIGEQSFQGVAAVEQDLHVRLIFQILHEGGIGKHRSHCLVHGVVAAFSPASGLPIPKESFHEIIGSLRLNLNGSLGGIDLDRIGEQFVPVFVDLLDHLLVLLVRGILRPVQFPSEPTNITFNGPNVLVHTIAIQSV